MLAYSRRIDYNKNVEMNKYLMIDYFMGKVLHIRYGKIYQNITGRNEWGRTDF